MPRIVDLKQSKDTFILLSAGSPRKRSIPCSNILVDNECLIYHQIKAIRQFSKTADIILVTGFKSDLIPNTSITQIKNDNYETTNTIESLRIGINLCTDTNVFVIHGDLLFNRFALLLPNKDNYYISIANNMKNTKFGLIHSNNVLLNMSYGLRDKWGQMLYVPQQKLNKVKNIVNTMHKKQSIPDLINIININEEVLIYQHKKSIIMEIE